MSRPTAETMTARWSSAVVEGWVDLQRLGAEAAALWPACGMADCGHRARFVDPSGVGWCKQHRARGLHHFPDFARAGALEVSRG